MSKLKQSISELLESTEEDIIIAFMLEKLAKEYINNNIGKGSK